MFCHSQRIDELLHALGEELRENVIGFDEMFEPIDGVRVDPISLAHDCAGSHGFLIESFGCRVGYATDLGRVPNELVERFVDLDVLAIESNYDPLMQERSGRPHFLKQRIMGGAGISPMNRCWPPCGRYWIGAKRCCARLPATLSCCTAAGSVIAQMWYESFFARCANRTAAYARRAIRGSAWLAFMARAALVGEQLMLGWG